MPSLPRFAVGAVQAGTDPRPAVWALMDVLARRGLQVQSFFSRACLQSFRTAQAITGVAARHLDSWLMSPDDCREIFAHGARNCDLALVEGQFELPPACARHADGLVGPPPGSRLDELCAWLDLPRLAVLDVTRLECCSGLPLPITVDAVLLDRLPRGADWHRYWTALEPLCGVPVVGGVVDSPEIRKVLADLPRCDMPDPGLCRQLGEQLADNFRFDPLWQLAERCPFPRVVPRLFRPSEALRPLHVAVAYDEAFHCYFHETLERLELGGAKVSDFSPLRDERLPAGADVVLFGCGQIEPVLDELAANHCMMLALRQHVFAGGRVYAQGDGLPYLCREIDVGDGRPRPMAGVLPATVRLDRQAPPPEPVEIRLACDTWLGPADTPLRGYLNRRWQITPQGCQAACLSRSGEECDVVAAEGAIASRVHLNFAVLPHMLDSFFQPHAVAPAAG